MTTDVYEIAGVPIALEGEHPMLTRVRAELSAVRTNGLPLLSISVSDAPLPPHPATAVTLGPVTASSDNVWLDLAHRGFRVLLSIDGRNVRCQVSVSDFPVPVALPRPLYRWLNPTYLSDRDAQAYVFIVAVLEPMLLWFAPDVGMIHAAAVEQNNRIAVLCSAGGVGKTSTATALLGRAGWNFVSDDILPLQRSREVTPYPRRVMVYDYNIRANAALATRLFKSQSHGSLLHWRIHRLIRNKRLRRRVAASVLFGDERVSRGGTLSVAAFLVRDAADRSDVVVRELDPADFARRAAAITAVEFRDALALLAGWEGTGRAAVSVQAVMERQRQVFAAAFASTDSVVEVGIPRRASFEDVASTIVNLFDAVG